MERIWVAVIAIAFFLGMAIGLGVASIENYGGEGQTCYRNQTCDEGLQCLSNLCVEE